jgi:hypothetical protein
VMFARKRVDRRVSSFAGAIEIFTEHPVYAISSLLMAQSPLFENGGKAPAS